MTRDLKQVQTPLGPVAYEERGTGPAALFVHGIYLNGHVWRGVVDQVSDVRRCLSVDLPGHGGTPGTTGTDMSFPSLAEVLEAFCEALDLDQVDVVGNDSGGGIVQIFAARHPERIRTLTLTNCDTHDNWPPPAFEPIRQAMLASDMRKFGETMLANLDGARASLTQVYEHAERVDDDTLRTYYEPLVTDENADALRGWLTEMDNRHTVEVEPQLRELNAPTLIVWATDDVFFPLKWAHWLRDTIPGAHDVIEVEGARLFFIEERPDALAGPLREHWTPVEAPAG